MNNITLTKKQMLTYWDAQAAIIISVIQDAEKANAPIPLDGLRSMVKDNKNTRIAIEQAPDDYVFVLPNANIQTINDLISSE